MLGRPCAGSFVLCCQWKRRSLFASHAVPLALLFQFAFLDGLHRVAALSAHNKFDSLVRSQSATCKEVLQPAGLSHAKYSSFATLRLAPDEAEKRVHAVYCWMLLCRMAPDATKSKSLAETCGRGLRFWEWSSGKHQVKNAMWQLKNISSQLAAGTSKVIFPLVYRFPTENASALNVQNVVMKRYVNGLLYDDDEFENSCGQDALDVDVQFHQMMLFWTDAAFMEFLRGKPGIPKLFGAGDDPEYNAQMVPVSVVSHIGNVRLDSEAYLKLARSHARELALAILRMFQSVCDGGAFQLDQGPEQYMATHSAFDDQVDVWMIDSPTFFAGPVTKYQRKLGVPSQTSTDGRKCLVTRLRPTFLECDAAASYPFFPATSYPIPDSHDCTIAALEAACCDDGSRDRDALATEECSAASTDKFTELIGVSGVDFAALRARFEPSESGREAMCRQTIVRLTVGLAVGSDFLLLKLAAADAVVKRVVEALKMRLRITAAGNVAQLSDDVLAATGITTKVLPPDLERLLTLGKQGTLASSA
eukprot:6178586-Pleurochrysis_carterae.AAC.3